MKAGERMVEMGGRERLDVKGKLWGCERGVRVILGGEAEESNSFGGGG